MMQSKDIWACEDYFLAINNSKHFTHKSTEDIKNNCMLPAPVAIHFNKILQEIVQNIIKHSHASVIQYCINSNDQELKISLADNGIGFDVNKTGRGTELKISTGVQRKPGLAFMFLHQKNKEQNLQ